MRKAVLFDEFSGCCPYFNFTDENSRYGCKHSKQSEKDENGKGLCYCFSCPLGTEAEQEDLDESDAIDWDGLCEGGEVEEGEILLLDANEDAPDDIKETLNNYDAYLNRYSN